MAKKYSPWFPGTVKPVREGYYECQCCQNRYWWNGRYWTWDKNKTEKLLPLQAWRGLAYDPVNKR